MTKRQGRSRKKLLDDLKDRRGYSHLKEEALDRNMWRDRFGRGFEHVVRLLDDDDVDRALSQNTRRQKLGSFVQIFWPGRATWRPGFLHPRFSHISALSTSFGERYLSLSKLEEKCNEAERFGVLMTVTPQFKVLLAVKSCSLVKFIGFL